MMARELDAYLSAEEITPKQAALARARVRRTVDESELGGENKDDVYAELCEMLGIDEAA